MSLSSFSSLFSSIFSDEITSFSICGFVSKNEIDVTWFELLLFLSSFLMKRLLFSVSNITLLLFLSFDSIPPKLNVFPEVKLISLIFSTSITALGSTLILFASICLLILNSIQFSGKLLTDFLLPNISNLDESVVNSNSFLFCPDISNLDESIDGSNSFLLLLPDISILEESVDNSNSFLLLILLLLVILILLLLLITFESILILFLLSLLILISFLLILNSLFLLFIWLFSFPLIFIPLLLEILISLFFAPLFDIDNPFWFEGLNSTLFSLLFVLFSWSSSSLSTSWTPYNSLIALFWTWCLLSWELKFLLRFLSFNLKVW